MAALSRGNTQAPGSAVPTNPYSYHHSGRLVVWQLQVFACMTPGIEKKTKHQNLDSTLCLGKEQDIIIINAIRKKQTNSCIHRSNALSKGEAAIVFSTCLSSPPTDYLNDGKSLDSTLAPWAPAQSLAHSVCSNICGINKWRSKGRNQKSIRGQYIAARV